MSDLRKLRALPAPERRLLAACSVAGPIVAAGVRVLGLRRTCAVLARWAPVAQDSTWSGPAAAERACTVARLAAIAARRGPIRVTCVPRSLLVWWLLRRDGIDAAVRIGVAGAAADFRAHAWVEHEGVPLDEASGPSGRFTPFDRDFAAPAGTVP